MEPFVCLATVGTREPNVCVLCSRGHLMDYDAREPSSSGASDLKMILWPSVLHTAYW